MKVAISSSGQGLNSHIDPRFGRCAYFLMIETDDMSFEVFDNESAGLGGGAGIQSAQFIISKGAKAVITGNCGPNAVKTLSVGGVEVFLGNTGIVRKVLEKLKNGELTSTNIANASEYSGLRGRTSSGRGIGLGGQRGMGHGRGMGGQRGLGAGRNKT
ncbi:MAG: NifB/NifX family molybdenum-iron cluster-binding protein [Deltaproteobacteria bacterium]|nr:NifB/NifX family molybdenum-iron cluster-binding protein [Deltaproteobacteria bacterium]